jgi:hypothetical protein
MADRLREKLDDILGTIDILQARIPGNAKHLVLKYVRMGILYDERVINEDLRALLRLARRAEQLRAEIHDLRTYSARRREAAFEQALARLSRG